MPEKRRVLYRPKRKRLFYWFRPPAEYPPEFLSTLKTPQVQTIFDRYQQRGGRSHWLRALLWQFWQDEPKLPPLDLTYTFELKRQVQRLVTELEALARRYPSPNVITARRALQAELTKLEGAIGFPRYRPGRPSDKARANRINLVLALLYIAS